MKKLILLLFPAALYLAGCSGKYTPPVFTAPFEHTPVQPDYSLETSWCALPTKTDNADRVPRTDGVMDVQNLATADVFFLHPTSYLKHTAKSTSWNADISDKTINEVTDNGSILYQASVFNGACKVYAPRYRQAFIYSYYTVEKSKGSQAFDTAYSDIKRAFEYYLANYNHGRPFIIASHSQGTTHAKRLLKEFFDDGGKLSEQLIAAYLVGMDVYDTAYSVITPCKDPFDSRCYVSWRTFAKDYFPPGYQKPKHEAVCTNPITWKTDSTYAGRDLNYGGILKRFEKVIPNICDAQVQDGVVRISKPHFRGRMFFNFKNYHIVDYNLFYFNIRENVRDRVRLFNDARPNESRQE